MADFFNDWWGIWIAILVALSIAGCVLLLWSQSKVKVKIGEDGKPLPAETTGHVWDGDLMENNNPLPRWWSNLFYLTVVFSIAYLILFPGFGAMQGILGWSQAAEYDKEIQAGDAQFGPIFNKYIAMDIPVLAKDSQAREIGQRLYMNSCALCHGSDAQGSKGFPNLADHDWLYGGDPKVIETSIREGRRGMMPPMAAAVGGEADVRNLAHYVLSLSDSTHDPIKAVLGKPKFAACAACHGASGKGNQVLGAPNLTDRIWLYGGGIDNVMETITKGRGNNMPAHENLLSDAKIHLLAAYVWGLSNNPSAGAMISVSDAKEIGSLANENSTAKKE